MFSASPQTRHLRVNEYTHPSVMGPVMSMDLSHMTFLACVIDRWKSLRAFGVSRSTRLRDLFDLGGEPFDFILAQAVEPIK
jgi:hypothetical protein